jgi:hypothetical protein
MKTVINTGLLVLGGLAAKATATATAEYDYVVIGSGPGGGPLACVPPSPLFHEELY